MGGASGCRRHQWPAALGWERRCIEGTRPIWPGDESRIRSDGAGAGRDLYRQRSAELILLIVKPVGSVTHDLGSPTHKTVPATACELRGDRTGRPQALSCIYT